MSPFDNSRWRVDMRASNSVLRFTTLCLFVSLALGAALVRAAEAPDFAKSVQPFFKEHCYRCHGERKQKGDLRMDTLAADFTSPKLAMHWADVMDRISAAEMPPEDEDQPKPEEAARVVEWISTQLNEAEAARQATAARVTFHKLTREEYANTIRDLLGVNYDARDPAGLPEDPDWQGFERIGSVLTISAAHVEKYLAAAETVLNEALALGSPPKSSVVRWTAAERRVRHELVQEFKTKGILEKARIDIVPNNGSLDAVDLKIDAMGEYVVRVKLSGLRAVGGRAARLRIYATDLNRTLFEQDVEAPEDQPITLEFRTHLPVGTHLIRIVNAVPGPNPEERASRPLNSKPFFKMSARQPWQIKLTDDDGLPIWPTLILDSIEWQGPVQAAWPPPAHRQIFFGGDTATNDLPYAREILSRFAARAWRRPVQPAEVDRLMKLVENAQQLGDSFESAVKTGLLAVLCSESFIYLVEGSPAAPVAKLTDWELASRLSYFLWSTMPDQHLIELAGQGQLHQPDTLRAEVRRMMQDPKALAFADSFPRQWLQLRRVGMFEPDKKIYPDYDEYLEKSMVGESTAFFREVLQRQLGLREFLDSDWTMVNERLASHYSLPGIQGEPWRRVALQPDDHRGGLLTQAAILSLTSDGTRHRPVHRGKWVLESIIGKPPPPPPANVPAIKTSAPNERKTSLREKLEAHKDDANCAACHRKIDPLGLAFDNYDAIGHWRTEEAVRDGAGENPKLDPSGELPDGRKFANAAELKKLMVADLDKFAAAFTEKLATYALRRGMTFADRPELKHIADQTKPDDYRLSALIETLVLSDLFQKR
jgi:mono/diheme cytochrome c family protein